MTVVCVRDGVMAVDRMMSDDGVFCGEIQKWLAVPQVFGGGYIAAAGVCSKFYNRMRHFAETGDGPHDDSEDCSYVHLRSDGVVMLCGKGGWFPAGAPFVSEGSGRFPALAAMEAGASAEAAARITCKIMPGSCGGPIDILRI